MKRTKIEQLLVAIAWIGLIGGIVFGVLVSKGLFESGMEMCFPQAVVVLVCSVFASVAGWAVLMQIVNISDRLRKLEDQLGKQDNNK